MIKNSLHYYNRLLEERDKVKESLENVGREINDSMDSYYTELSGYDNHPADIATEVFMMEQGKGMKNKLANTLREIEESFDDMDKGQYGVCKSCNKEINEERLDLIPYLKTCVECSSELTPEVNFRQLIDDKVTSNLYGTIKEDNVYFDREDTLQQAFMPNIVENDPSSSTGDNMGIMDEDNDAVEDVEKISQEYYNGTLE
ncbi:MAG: TraR/DksA C4-type zinc finger protein [Tissierellaceae bacterium]|nr:TraR/DksA C4-type zinc finger protein [Tissierellaceae bacterium]